MATPPLPRREAGYIPVYQSSTSPGTISATVTYCPGSGAGPPTSAGPWTNIHKTGDREISRPVARTREESADWGRRTSGTHTRQAASWERPHHAIASSRRRCFVILSLVALGPAEFVKARHRARRDVRALVDPLTVDPTQFPPPRPLLTEGLTSSCADRSPRRERDGSLPVNTSDSDQLKRKYATLLWDSGRDLRAAMFDDGFVDGIRAVFKEARALG